ncbi:hypothetical protein [Halopelagius fulvigenes]|uniref:Halobacterial output domain-containing protein n=1 Tax=Halopelagius fulvigenes TaxID=1198324 RepID=A0ABD5U1N0_9EURY
MSIETPTAGVTPTLAKVEETFSDGAVDQLVVRIDGDDDHAVVLTASGTSGGEGVRLARIAPVGTTSLSREMFPLVVEGIAELRDRVDGLDLGAFATVIDDGADAVESPDIQTDEREEDDSEASAEDDADRYDADDADDSESKVWCGICGKGPYQSLNIHHGQMHPDDEPIPLDHEPDAPLDQSPEASNDADIPEWCDGHPSQIVADATTPRTLAEVLNEVEAQETALDVHRRIGMNSLMTTKDLLGKLGLLQSNETLVEDDVLEERIAALREVAD